MSAVRAARATVVRGSLRDRAEISFVLLILTLNAAVYIAVYSLGLLITTPVILASMLAPVRLWEPVLDRIPNWQQIGLRFSDRTAAWVERRFPGFFPADVETDSPAA